MAGWKREKDERPIECADYQGAAVWFPNYLSGVPGGGERSWHHSRYRLHPLFQLRFRELGSTAASSSLVAVPSRNSVTSRTNCPGY